jgi:hypothetical protein
MPLAAAGAEGVRCSATARDGSAARESDAVRIRPVTTNPAANPETTRTSESVKRRNIV